MPSLMWIGTRLASRAFRVAVVGWGAAVGWGASGRGGGRGMGMWSGGIVVN